MSTTSTKRTCRLANNLQMAKLLDANARTEEARIDLQECQMNHTDVDYREFNYFNTELSIVVDNLKKNKKNLKKN
tara:strand:- start:12563 stop:12787 length:225 start_codon:yes stop_codon:yes gene_type:complete